MSSASERGSELDAESHRRGGDAALSEERFRLMADSIPQLAWMAKGDGSIFWYNRRWYDYTGTTFAQMEGWGWQSVHDPAELPRVVEKWKISHASGEPWEDVFPLRRHDGQMRLHLSRAAAERFHWKRAAVVRHEYRHRRKRANRSTSGGDAPAAGAVARCRRAGHVLLPHADGSHRVER